MEFILGTLLLALIITFSVVIYMKRSSSSEIPVEESLLWKRMNALGIVLSVLTLAVGLLMLVERGSLDLSQFLFVILFGTAAALQAICELFHRALTQQQLLLICRLCSCHYILDWLAWVDSSNRRAVVLALSTCYLYLSAGAYHLATTRR